VLRARVNGVALHHERRGECMPGAEGLAEGQGAEGRAKEVGAPA
jgi:hypothetical protein